MLSELGIFRRLFARQDTKLPRYLSVLPLVIVSLFVILVAVQASKKFVLDEIDFPVVAHATSLTGKPIYYRGEATPLHVGTYHPTLYINSLAAFIKIFGFNETSVRMFGAVCVLLSAWLLILILRQLTGRHWAGEGLLLALFLLNPYTIANATLPDIDSTVLPVVLLLFIYVALHYLYEKRDMGTEAMLVLSGLFALALWSKLTTPLVIPPLLLGFALITTRRWRPSLWFAIRVSALGAIAFVVTYFIYCKGLGLSTTYTYHFLVDSFTKGTSSDGPVAGAIKNINNIRTFVYWPTLPVVVLIGVSLLGTFLDSDKSEATRIKQLLALMALLVTVFYIALISPFGGFFKYPFPAFGLLILTVVFFYDRYLRNVALRWYLGVVALAVGFELENLVWKDSMFKTGAVFSHLLVLLAAIIVVYAMVLFERRRIAASLFVMAMVFAVGFGLSISRVQAKAPYPTKYLYGQTGLDQTISYLQANTQSNEVIWSMKDVGYYVNNHYEESYSYYFDKDLQGHLIDLLQAGKVHYYVATDGIGQDNINYYTDIKHILDTYGVKDKQFGDYIIYKAKD